MPRPNDLLQAVKVYGYTGTCHKMVFENEYLFLYGAGADLDVSEW